MFSRQSQDYYDHVYKEYFDNYFYSIFSSNAQTRHDGRVIIDVEGREVEEPLMLP